MDRIASSHRSGRMMPRRQASTSSPGRWNAQASSLTATTASTTRRSIRRSNGKAIFTKWSMSSRKRSESWGCSRTGRHLWRFTRIAWAWS